MIIIKRSAMLSTRLATWAALLLPALAAAAAGPKTVEYEFRLRPRRAQSQDPTLSPDCNLDRLMLLVNDEFPGPAIRANVGDTVKVTVSNESPTDPLALHFHGLTMRGQPYADGTAGATQCASGPLQTQVYEFVVSNSGTHYWHGREFSSSVLFFVHLIMHRDDLSAAFLTAVSFESR